MFRTRGPRRSGCAIATGSRSESDASCCAGRAQVEGESELADLDFVSGLQFHAVHAVVVHVGAVEAARVHDLEAAGGAAEFDMAARDGHVVKEDIRIGV